MALRRLLGCLPVAALAVLTWTACKDKGDVAGARAGAAELAKRCERMGALCGDKGKHVEKIREECTQAAKDHVARGCTAEVLAVYDCYERELCGSENKLWALDDLRVLAERHGKCVAERDASRACTEK